MVNESNESELMRFISDFYILNECSQDYESAFWECEELLWAIRKSGDGAVNRRLDEIVKEANEAAEMEYRKEWFGDLIKDRGLELISEDEVKRLVKENFAEFENERKSDLIGYVKKIVKAWFLDNYIKKEK